ncbi:olfactory receptor 56B34-like [Discoglossus pictus]
MANQTDVLEFVLLGFPGLQPQFRILVSLVIFLVFLVASLANSIVIILIILRHHLHQPMYIIIGNLALSDLLFDTITLPKIIAMYWFGDGNISFFACMFQIFFAHNLGSLDSFIIMLMAIDRYVAICTPLRYCSIITNKRVAFYCCICWFSASIIGLAIAAVAMQLPYCGPNRVKNCFCTNTAVTSLACAGSALSRRFPFIISIFVHLVPLSFIIYTYTIIIRTVRSSSRSDNWQKALYTSTTHLFIIGLYYIPRMTVYGYNQVQLISNADVNTLLIFLYTFVPHVASPIIYCLRTKEIKIILGKIFRTNFGTEKHRPRIPVIVKL